MLLLLLLLLLQSFLLLSFFLLSSMGAVLRSSFTCFFDSCFSPLGTISTPRGT